MKIFEIRTYMNEAGTIIQAKIDPSDNTTVYCASASLQFAVGDQPGQMPFAFEIPATSIDEAFAGFDAALEKAKTTAEANLRTQIAARQNEQRRQMLLSGGGIPIGRPRTRHR